MQTKIILRFHPTPIRMAKIKRLRRQELPVRMCRKKNTPALQVESQPHWKSVSRFLRKLDSLMGGYYPRISEHLRYNSHTTEPYKEDQRVALRFFWEGELNTGAKIETKCGAETERNVIQRLPHLRVHPIFSPQTPTLLWMLRNACWKEPYMTISWEALQEHDKYRERCSQPIIGLSSGSPMEEPEKALKMLKGFASP